jgi:hypothetical protein
MRYGACAFGPVHTERANRLSMSSTVWVASDHESKGHVPIKSGHVGADFKPASPATSAEGGAGLKPAPTSVLICALPRENGTPATSIKPISSSCQVSIAASSATIETIACSGDRTLCERDPRATVFWTVRGTK